MSKGCRAGHGGSLDWMDMLSRASCPSELLMTLSHVMAWGANQLHQSCFASTFLQLPRQRLHWLQRSCRMTWRLCLMAGCEIHTLHWYLSIILLNCWWLRIINHTLLLLVNASTLAGWSWKGWHQDIILCTFHLSCNCLVRLKDNIMCMIGDNCNVNRSLADLLRVILIGWGAHKFNLAVRKWISNEPQVSTVNNIAVGGCFPFAVLVPQLMIFVFLY